ncbi:MAG: OsmC family protein [Desulfotignum sp.]|nr:OsmC family protein [Desulfotignum sp.]MCF8114545.1 OsmC family protein [Desulfotignum sp.]MCF8125060.1 OsmC family protein [Desulfotignum sp.]
MTMEISFPGNKKVTARYRGFIIETDQAREEGGDGSAPEPFDLFLSSMGTCAGVYVKYFCEERNIDTKGMKMSLLFDRNEQTHLVETVHIHINLPPGFPEKYRSAVEKTAGLCTVKRNILNPPHFEVSAQIQAE